MRSVINLLIVMVLIAPFTPYMDHFAASYFYEAGNFSRNDVVSFIYDYFAWAGIAISLLALLAFLYSYLSKKHKSWRKPSLYLVLCMVVGGQFIVHNLLKDNWGRPRPKQVEQYGGTAQYRPFWSPDFSPEGSDRKSFVCGHCAAGFYFFAFYFLGRRLHNQRLAWVGLTTGLLFGFTLGYARIAQGGHFVSDVLFSGAVMWLTCWALDKLLLQHLPPAPVTDD